MKNIKTLLPKDKLDDNNLEKIKLLNDSDLFELPLPFRRPMIFSSKAMSAKCRPVVGSSRI